MTGINMPNYWRITFEIWFGAQSNTNMRNLFRLSDVPNSGGNGNCATYPVLWLIAGRTDFAVRTCHCINGVANHCFDFIPR